MFIDSVISDTIRMLPYWFHFAEAGANMVPWAEIYGGPQTESEVETRNLRQYLDSLAGRMHVYISLHSYSQLLMFPWGYTREKIATHDQLVSWGCIHYNTSQRHVVMETPTARRVVAAP